MRFAWILLSSTLVFSSFTIADTVTCLGRIEPVDGVILLAGPSGVAGGTAVIAELKVEERAWVEEGQVLAILDDFNLRSAESPDRKNWLKTPMCAWSDYRACRILNPLLRPI